MPIVSENGHTLTESVFFFLNLVVEVSVAKCYVFIVSLLFKNLKFDIYAVKN